MNNKFVNELIFLAFHIVPIYPIAYLADVLVLNSIEFWSGRNPVSSIGDQKEIKGEDGANYTVTTTADGYRIAKEGENVSLDLVYDKKDRTWNAVSGKAVRCSMSCRCYSGEADGTKGGSARYRYNSHDMCELRCRMHF